MANKWCMGFCSFWLYQTEKKNLLEDLHHNRARQNNNIRKHPNTDWLGQRKRPSILNKNKLALFTLTPSDRNNHCNMSNKHNFVLLLLVCLGLGSKWYKCHSNQAVVVWCVVMKVPGDNTQLIDDSSNLFLATKTLGGQSDSSFSSLVVLLSTVSLLSKGGIWSATAGDWFWESWQGPERWAFEEASSVEFSFSPSTYPSGSSWSCEEKK